MAVIGFKQCGSRYVIISYLSNEIGYLNYQLTAYFNKRLTNDSSFSLFINV